MRPIDLAVAEVDGDGALDIVTIDAESDALVVFFGDGSLTSWEVVEYPAPIGVRRVAVADLDGDGRVEIVRGSALTGFVDAVTIDGERQAEPWSGACVASGHMVAAAGEGWPLVLADGDGSLHSLQLSTDSTDPRGLVASTLTETPFAPAALGLGSLVSQGNETDAVVLDIGGGGGVVRDLAGAPTTQPFEHLRDARALTATEASGPLILSETSGLLGIIDGTLLQRGQPPPNALGVAPALTGARLDGDVSDLVILGDDTLMWLRRILGPLRLDEAVPTELSDALVLIDVDGDGGDEVLGVHPSAGVGVLDGSGVFHALVGALAMPGEGALAVAGDLDGDGMRDLVLFAPVSGEWTSLRGLGDGDFDVLATSTLASPAAAALADLSGDGIDDLIVVRKDDRQRQIFVGVGDGAWIVPPVVVGGEGGVPFIGDLSGDGRDDLAFLSQAPPSIELFLGGGDLLASSPSISAPLSTSISGHAAIVDTDQDGRAELVVCQRGAPAFDERPRLTRVRLAEGDAALVVDAAVLADAAPPPALLALPDELACGPLLFVDDPNVPETVTTLISGGSVGGEATPTLALAFAWSAEDQGGRFVRAQSLTISGTARLLTAASPSSGGLALVSVEPGAAVYLRKAMDDVLFVERAILEMPWPAR